MTITELKSQLLALSITEKNEIFQLLKQDLDDTWVGIEKSPGVVGGDACVAGTRIPVWDLVHYRQMGASDHKILEAYPHLTAANLENAWVYAAAFPEEIAEAIAANEAA